jgi:hypothetical protein
MIAYLKPSILVYNQKNVFYRHRDYNLDTETQSLHPSANSSKRIYCQCHDDDAFGQTSCQGLPGEPGICGFISITEPGLS